MSEKQLELVKNVLRMLRTRKEWNEDCGYYESALSYDSAAAMLQYALDENEECLRQYDYYV